jgi:hypothetical protein
MGLGPLKPLVIVSSSMWRFYTSDLDFDVKILAMEVFTTKKLATLPNKFSFM